MGERSMKLPSIQLAIGSLVILTAYFPLQGADKNGVSPQVISIPTGPGSVSGLGESFQPQINNGGGAYAITIRVPKGPNGLTPQLALQYHTGNGNGPLGIGWKLSSLTMISRNIDHGLPLYVESDNGLDDDFDGVVDNPEEIDTYSGVDLEELIPLPDSTFRSENENTFMRYERSNAGWQVREKNGTLHEFGMSGSSQIENAGRVFSWLLERTTDRNGNSIEYRYVSDAGSPGQKYCKEIRWAETNAFYAVVMNYDNLRPDVHSDFRSGFEVRTGLRLSRIDIIAQGVPPSPGALVGDFNEDGTPDELIRRYVLEYEPQSIHSLLTRVTMVGSDGVTSLPPITFAYTEWLPPDNVSSSMVLSSGDAAVGLDSSDVELIDMNDDGLPDLLTTTGIHRVHLNLGMNDLGRLEWDTVGVTVANAPSLNLGSTSVHLADHSADGEADLIQKVNDSTFQCFLNSGQLKWQTAMQLHNTDSWPRWPFENSGSRTLDTDHNRMNDVLFTSDTSYRLWMMMPGGKYGREVSLPVLSDGTQIFKFSDPGARIADLNGDRISDLVWIQSNRIVYWASCGRGNFDGPIILPFAGSLNAGQIAAADFADINGDGLPDFILIRPAASPNGIQYRLNLGLAGFDSLRTIAGLPAVQSGDTIRFADMNGNGSVDFLISNSARPSGTREQFLDFVPGIRPNLLRQIDNGLGLVTTMKYESSVQQMISARNAGQPWASTMPISVPVVAQIIQDDSRGNQTIREFTYRDPHFDAPKQEFHGFAQTKVREVGDSSAPTRVTQYSFDTGILAECSKGKIMLEEISDDFGAVFSRVENTIEHRSIGSSSDGHNVCFAFNGAVNVDVIENSANPVHLRTEYEYDDFGNALDVNKFGIVGQDGDEVLVENSFDYRFDIWLMDRVSRSTTRDGSGVQVADSLYDYDSHGNLTQRRDWLNTDDRYIAAIRNDFDAFGNIIRTTDANGHGRSFDYDALLHAYPVAEHVHLEGYDLDTSATYDLAYGVPTEVIDFAGATTNIEYDALARTTAILRSGGAETRYSYELSAPVSRVITKVREDAGGGTFDSYAYTDGLGRDLGSKIEGEDGQWRFVDAVAYNARKTEKTHWLPYFTSADDYETPDDSKAHKDFHYDSQGRKVQTTNPDGTFSRASFEPLIVQQHDENDTAGLDTPTTIRRDGLDRVVEVIERSESEAFNTTYTWDSLGDLVSITDAQNNRKSMTFDSLKRNIALNDPDRGIMNYEYDDVSNVIRTVDANGQQTLFSYDFANRLLTENYLDQGGGPTDPIDIRYSYDLPSQNVSLGDETIATATFTGGRLASVIDLSGEEYRSYDARGNNVWTAKSIKDPPLGIAATYTTGFDYDLMNRMIAVHYPDGDRCLYHYNSASFLVNVGGGQSGQAILADAAYTAFAQPTQLSFGNGVITNYAYDNRDRLVGLESVAPTAGKLFDYSYVLDPVSNVTRIDDLRPLAGANSIPEDSPRRNTQLFQYDDLYRLTNVKYSPSGDGTPMLGQIDYTYDRIGNMVSQVTPPPDATGHIADSNAILGALTIGGAAGTENRVGRLPGEPPGPHALTAAQTGKEYTYDANGDMVALDDAKLTWDFKDRLVRFQKRDIDAKYTYDYTGRRISKIVNQKNHAAATFYVNPYFEYRPGNAPIKYVLSGDARIAQVKGTLDPTQPRIQKIWLSAGWNLCTVAVETNQTAAAIFGPGARAYEWTGSEYLALQLNATPPTNKAIWVEVPNTGVAIAIGAPISTKNSLPIPAGQSLVAWPRMESFDPLQNLSSASLRLQAHDPNRSNWILSDPTLPQNVADVVQSLPSTTGFWLTTSKPITLLPNATDDQDTIFYHGDHLGSTHIVTDRNGSVIREVAYYPFGEIRNIHAPATSVHNFYGFGAKEQDAESDLQYFEARYLAGPESRFITPDPKFVSPAMLPPDELSAFLMQPQKLNPYSYVMNNPLKYSDPSGLDVNETSVDELEHGSHTIETGATCTEATLVEGAEVLEHASEGAAFLKALGITAGGLSVATSATRFASHPSAESGNDLVKTTAITVVSIADAPVGATLAATDYTMGKVYRNSPNIHTAANKFGDFAANLPGGSRVGGGVAAAEASVVLTAVKTGAMLGGGQQAGIGIDMLIDWLAD